MRKQLLETPIHTYSTEYIILLPPRHTIYFTYATVPLTNCILTETDYLQLLRTLRTSSH